jgi:uncharacterized membrane protein YdfJ with MMPL/SSD domain
MDASTSSLVVAVVGVLGTLVSGILAHRSALRSKMVELEHASQQRQEEQHAQERREMLEARRASYAIFNQNLRQFHAALSRRFLDLATEQPDAQQPRPEVEEARHALRTAYAEAQMVASDEVLEIGGSVVRQLFRIQSLLDPPGQEEKTSAEALDEAKDWLEQVSEGLYEVRQTMRKDLGITELPIQRPYGYGSVEGGKS